MRCDELRKRLDEAGPAGLGATHLAHARACAACAAELQSAEAVESMLRAAPPAASASFTSHVMGRVEATERARQRLAELPRVSLWERWWKAVAEEPIAVVALALAPIPIFLALVWPGTAATFTAFVRNGLAGWIATTSSGALFARDGVAGLSAPMWAMADLLAIPVLLALTLLGFQRVGEGFGGSVSSASRAHKASTSRRKPS